LIKRSSQGLLGAIETMGIIEELMEIWLNEVCDITTMIPFIKLPISQKLP